MFNDGFYPTPWRVAMEMLINVRFDYKVSVLEPSAGKGDLCDFIAKKYKSRNRYKDGLDIDTLELDPELRMILKGKGYRVVGFDFLRFDTFKRYDWIFMNPPFADGDAHLTKALNLLKPGGTCVCVLNAETIDNPYTNTRKALISKLEKWGADTKTRMIDAFKGDGVEREADVTVAVIRVPRPVTEERPTIVLDKLKKDFLESQEQAARFCTDLIIHDTIKQAIPMSND